MKSKIIVLTVLLLAIVSIFSACDVHGKKKAEEERVRKDHQKQQKEDIFNGKVGIMNADSALKNSLFVDGDKTHQKIVFAADTNSCTIEGYSSGGYLAAKPVLESYPAAEYTVQDGTVTLSFKKYSTRMSKITEDEVLEQYKIQAYSAMKKEGAQEADLDKLWQEHIKELEKHGGLQKSIKFFQEYYVKTYTEYLKEPPLEGVLSADKKTITFKKFAIPDDGEIKRYENVVFTRQ